MVQTFDLNGKTILITGGYGHLGKAVTESLVYHGGTVYVLARSKEKYQTAFSEHPENGEKLFCSECDISDTSSVKYAFQIIADESGAIDVLINNAFYVTVQDPLSMTDVEWSDGVGGTLITFDRPLREGRYIEYDLRDGAGGDPLSEKQQSPTNHQCLFYVRHGSSRFFRL